MAKNIWAVAEAKARFSELLDRVAREGPQKITRNGSAAAMLVPPDGALKSFGPPALQIMSQRPKGLVLDDPTIDALFLRGEPPPRARAAPDAAAQAAPVALDGGGEAVD